MKIKKRQKRRDGIFKPEYFYTKLKNRKKWM